MATSFGPRDKSDGREPGRQPRPSHQRKAINPHVPDPVQALLRELERLAADKFSFPEMAKRIHDSGGERLTAVNIRRWRQGKEFPTEDAVRRWTLLCGGDVASGIAGFRYWPRPPDEFVVGTCAWPVRARSAIDPVLPGGALLYKLRGEAAEFLATLVGGGFTVKL